MFLRIVDKYWLSNVTELNSNKCDILRLFLIALYVPNLEPRSATSGMKPGIRWFEASARPDQLLSEDEREQL